jgi:hypothetical protein
MRKVIREDATKFYLYNPIPIVKQEASEVIQRILRTHGISFEFGQDVDLNQLDTVNKMRMKDYIVRVLKYKEVRGHNIEGLMCGLFNGKLNDKKSGEWDYVIPQGTVEQKYVESLSESPVVGSYKSILFSFPDEVLRTIANITDKYGEKNIFLINDSELDVFKKMILEKMIVNIVCVSTKGIQKISNYYFTKEDFMNVFIDANNCAAPKQKDSYQLRMKSSTIASKAKKFDILIPKISQKEYTDYLSVSGEEQQVAQIFGPFSNKIRPDILKWINDNKESFKELVNSL